MKKTTMLSSFVFTLTAMSSVNAAETCRYSIVSTTASSLYWEKDDFNSENLDLVPEAQLKKFIDDINQRTKMRRNDGWKNIVKNAEFLVDLQAVNWSKNDFYNTLANQDTFAHLVFKTFGDCGWTAWPKNSVNIPGRKAIPMIRIGTLESKVTDGAMLFIYAPIYQGKYLNSAIRFSPKYVLSWEIIGFAEFL